MTGWFTPGRVRLLTLAVGIAGAELGLGFFAFWLWLGLRSSLDGPDFLDYYTAARLQLLHGPGRLYDVALQTQVQQAITAAAGWSSGRLLLPFLLPPWSALALVPLGLLPYRGAYVLMGLVTLAALAVAVTVLIRSAGERGLRAFALACLAAGFMPAGILLIQGQGNWVALLGLTLAARSWARGDEGRAGALMAATLFKPHLALLLPFLFIAHRSWRALAAYAGTAALLFLITLPFFGLSGWYDYVRLVLTGLGVGSAPVGIHSKFSLGAFLPAPLAVALLIAGALLIAFRRGDRSRDLALAITLSLLLAPYSQAHDLVLLLPALSIAAGVLPAAAAVAYIGVELMITVGAATGLLGMGVLVADLLRRGRGAPASDSAMPTLIH